MLYSIGLLLLFLTAQLATAQRLGSGGHVLTGYVREEASNSPVQSASLEILSSGTRAAPTSITGTEGEFRIGGLRDGDYHIITTKQGYETVSTAVTVMKGGTPPFVITIHRTKPSTDGPSSPDPVSTHQLSIPQKARESFEKGRKLLYEKSEPEKAIREFQNAVAQFPSYFEAYLEIGVANHRLGSLPAAEVALRKSIDLSSARYVDAIVLLTQMMNDQQRFSEAETLARQGLALDEFSWQSEIELARALVGLRRGADAEVVALKARDLKPDNANAYLVLANAHLQTRKYAEVIKDFDEYLKLQPNALGSADIRERRDRLQRALEEAQSKTSADPN